MKKELNAYDINQITIDSCLTSSLFYKIKIVFKYDRVIVYQRFKSSDRFYWIASFARGVIFNSDSLTEFIEDINNRLFLFLMPEDIEKSVNRLTKRRKQ